MVKEKRKPYTQLKLPALCKHCGRPLQHPARADKLFCSTYCRVKYWRVRRATQAFTQP